MKSLFLIFVFALISTHAKAAVMSSCEELVSSYQSLGFTGAVIIKVGDEIICDKDIAIRSSSKKNDYRDRFLIGSVTKQFTAAGILLLVQRNKLSLDDVLESYIPGIPNGSEITIKQILSHTSGIGEMTNTPSFDQLRHTPFQGLRPMVALIKEQAPDFSPGERWGYSNSNYILASAVTELVSGMGWDSFIRSEVLSPLKLTNTEMSFARTSELATGHMFDRDYALTPLRDEEYFERGWASGAGGIESTTMDLARWNESIFKGSFLSRSMIEDMMAPVGQIDNNTAYGLGVMVRTDLGEDEVVFHSGSIPGYSSMNIYIPNKDISVVVLSNLLDGQITATLAWGLLDVAFGREASLPIDDEIDVPVDHLMAKVGSYQFGDLGLVVKVGVDGESLYAEVTGDDEFRLIPLSLFRFRHRAYSLIFEFSEDAEELLIRQGGSEFRGVRIN